MGKKAKKKAQKEKRVLGHSPKIVPEQSNLNVEAVADVVVVPKDRKLCPHFDKGFDLNKLSEKIKSLNSLRCEDCREGAGKGARGKGKQGKKKGSGSVDSKSESKAIWVCVDCGHFACGGVGLPTSAQCHAIRHARQTRHPLVFQWDNPHLRWCFPCNTLIPVEKTEENIEKKDALLEVVKMIKAQSSEQRPADIEDVWFGRGSILSELNAEGIVSSGSGGGGGGCYVVRGLVNLGNTCFFNSVMQNLLAMDKLRDYFLNQEASFGPLSSSLKKLYSDLKPEIGLRNVINPKSFFGSVCSKAPQFRGYQQQDSHELLCCLLDGLSTEESVVRKRINADEEHGIPPKYGPTFVDSAFGGRISSTVCCVECGHSSTVHEPFLDLSLPVPTKKSPIEKVPLVSRAKKTKLPPKRGGKFQPKINRNADSGPAQSIPKPVVHSESPCQTESALPLTGSLVASSGNTPPSVSTCPTTPADANGLASLDLTVVAESHSKQVAETAKEQTADSFNDFWMDYIEPQTTLDEHDFASENNDISAGQQSGEKVDLPNDSLTETCRVSSVDGEANLIPDCSSVNPWEDDVLLQAQSSEVLLLPYKEESFTDGDIMKGEAEASSSFVDCGQDAMEFDGLGDLFNEPEVSAGPVAGPSLGAAAGPGFIAGNGSESDPDEVDNTDSPVSVESCLAHFMKPELLSNDDAWECENCSKILQPRRLDAKKKPAEVSQKTLINGVETQIQSNSTSLDKNISSFSDVGNCQNGNVDTHDLLNSNSEVFVSGDGKKIDCINKKCMQAESVQTGELKPFISQSEERKGEMNVALPEQSHSSGCYESCNGETLSGPQVDSCSVDETSSTGCTSGKVEQTNSHLSGNCEPDVSEEEVKTSKKMNVKRDATKRVLIDKAPPILTIHLKRFSQDARGRLSKLNGHVNFKEILDLRPYVDPRCVDTENFVYRLLGVVEHLGTMRGGHYVAYVRGGEMSKGKVEKENGVSVWYYASDAHVHQVSLEEVLSCDAYILFYEKT